MANFNPTDIVPRFRSDLKLTDTGHAAGENIVSVADPQSGNEMTLRGFELSLARMLNGARTARELVEKAASIGLPITLEALSRFVALLRAQGFVVDTPSPSRESNTTWPQRSKWPEEHRAQFQVALREARTNLLSEAKQHLVELQRDAFDSSEVKELDHWVEERLKENDQGKALPTFAEIFSSVERSWFEQGDLESDQHDKGVSMPAAVEVIALEAPSAEPRRRGPWFVLALIILAVTVVIVAVIPWPTRAPGTFVLSPQSIVAVPVSTPGIVGTVDAHEGQWVVAGEALFHYDTETPKKKLTEIEARQASLHQQLDQITQAVAPQEQQLADARAALQTEQAALDVAQAANRRRDTAHAQKQVKAAEDKIQAADAELAKARAEAETAAGVTRDALVAQLATATAEHDVQKALSELPPLKAPAPGVVTGLALKGGETVQPGAPVCRLEDTRKLGIVIHAEHPQVLHAPQSASATIDGLQVDVEIDKVEHGEGRGLVDNPDRKLKPGTHGDISIVVERRSLVARWL